MSNYDFRLAEPEKQPNMKTKQREKNVKYLIQIIAYVNRRHGYEMQASDFQ